MGQSKDPTASIALHFGIMTDPRVERTKLHSLHDILVIAICAVICGADAWTEVESFGNAKKAWFSSFLALRNGIPSHDTFGRVFAALDPKQFSECFANWLADVARNLTGQVVAIDGKTLRRSYDKASSKQAIHMVSAWAAETRLVLGQLKTEEKSNEITAIPELLKMLALRGCIVTIDAMGCQREIVADIVDQGADYVICLKGNQETLHDDVKSFFDWAIEEDFRDFPHDFAESIDKGHGRVETRRCWCTSDTSWFQELPKWKGLSSFAMVEGERTVGTETSVERRYFISSLDGKDAQAFARVVRSHWGVENELHWTLDVSFREDECRVRQGYAAENFSTLRRIALNLLKGSSFKAGIKGKRLRAGWDEDYLLKVLAGARN
jgi:predicted transposase YbfD/YdcC